MAESRLLWTCQVLEHRRLERRSSAAIERGGPNLIEKLARIVWLSSEQGGRTQPPTGPQFICPALIDGANEEWSLVLDQVNSSVDGAEWTANVHFLVSEAPQFLLKEGTRFELFEGNKRTAIGEVVMTSAPAFQNDPSVRAHEVSR